MTTDRARAHRASPPLPLLHHRNFAMSQSDTNSDIILERLLGLHPKLIDLSLERMQRLLKALAHPERALAHVIHVAGTNGKGSVVATLRAIYEAQGYRVHSYISPHLLRFHERIRLTGSSGQSAPITEENLSALLEECETANKGAPITYFEITTAAALLAFSRRPADLLLLEVGLGGRLDATNVIDQPALSIITPVSLDHQRFLGDELTEIATEKAGIIKAKTPVIVGPQADHVRAVIADTAEALRTSVYFYGQDWQVHEERGRLIYQDEGGLLDLPLPRLRGQHQIENAGIAIAATRVLQDFPVSEQSIEKGLQTTYWPGRFEQISAGALVSHIGEHDELWLDGGHNPAAGKALASVLADLEEHRPCPLIVICGMMNNKAAGEFIGAFTGLAREFYMVSIPEEENSFSAPELATLAKQTGFAAQAADSIANALDIIHKRNDSPVRILICGSLYLAGHVLRLNDR